MNFRSFRRGLVLGTGFSLLLISIVSAKNMWEYIITEFTNIYDIALLILGAWGISYVVYFWISFLLIGIKGLPGCVWTAILFALSKCDIHMLHICLDSVVNARQDLTQRDYGLFVKLLKIFRDILIN